MAACLDGINKICSTCGVEKLVIEYHKDSKKKDGLKSNCRACVAIYEEKVKQDNRDREAGLQVNPRVKGTVTRLSLTYELRNIATPERLKEIAEKIYDMASTGDTKAITILLDRLDGTVKQEVELSGEIATTGTEQLVSTANELLKLIRGKKDE